MSRYLYNYLWLIIAAIAISTGSADMSLADAIQTQPASEQNPYQYRGVPY